MSRIVKCLNLLSLEKNVFRKKKVNGFKKHLGNLAERREVYHSISVGNGSFQMTVRYLSQNSEILH